MVLIFKFLLNTGVFMFSSSRSNLLRFCLLSVVLLSTLTFAQKKNYLIIVDDQYEQNAKFQEFVTFREIAYNVTVKTLSEVGNSETGIKSAMQNLYDSDGLGYTLLIGNSGGGIPYKTGSYNTFHDYGLMDSDKQLDVAVGCFFVSNSSDLENIIHKTIHTEQNINDYPMVTTQFSSYTTRAHIEQQCNAIKDEYWEQSDYEVSWMIPPYSGGTSMQYVETLRNQINSNETSIIAFQAHGAETGWVNGGSYYSPEQNRQGLSFDVSDVRGLTNDEVYPIVMSFACVSGSFQLNGGFGENWTTAKGGACAFIGSSKNSSHYQKTLNASLASAFCQDEITTLGDLFVAGKNFLRDSTSHYQSVMTTQSSGSVSVVIADEQMYNLFGDPGLRIKPGAVANTTENKLLSTTNNIEVKSLSSKNLKLSIGKAGNYSIKLLSLNGETISNIANNRSLPSGISTLELNSNSAANGIYLLKVSGAGMTVTSKVSLIK